MKLRKKKRIHHKIRKANPSNVVTIACCIFVSFLLILVILFHLESSLLEMSFENSHNLTNNINNNNINNQNYNSNSNTNNNNRNDDKLITIKEEKLNYQRYFLKHDNFSEHTSSFIRTNFEQLNPHHHHYQQQLNSAMFSKNYQSENLLHHDIGSFDDFKKRKKSKDEYSLIKNDSNVRVSYILEFGPNSCKPPIPPKSVYVLTVSQNRLFINRPFYTYWQNLLFPFMSYKIKLRFEAKLLVARNVPLYR